MQLRWLRLRLACVCHCSYASAATIRTCSRVQSQAHPSSQVKCLRSWHVYLAGILVYILHFAVAPGCLRHPA